MRSAMIPLLIPLVAVAAVGGYVVYLVLHALLPAIRAFGAA